MNETMESVRVGSDTGSTAETLESTISYTLIEEWAAHLGSSKDRQNGVRTIHFRNDTIDVADQIALCLEGISVIPEAMTECQFTMQEQSGLCLITRMITEVAGRLINTLAKDVERVTERSNSLHLENSKIRGENSKEQRVPGYIAELLVKAGHSDSLEALEQLNSERSRAEVVTN